MSKKRIFAWSGIAYGLVALVTFGHCAAASEKSAEQSAVKCEAKGKSRYCDGPIDVPPLAGLLGAAVWPLYWSWELQA